MPDTEESPVTSVDRALRILTEIGEAPRGLSLDELWGRLRIPKSSLHRILAALNLTFNRLEKSVYHQERALALSPNYDLVVVQQGELLTWLGRPVEGIEWIRKAMRLNPYHPERFWSHLGRAQFTAKLYADAIQSYSRITAPDQLHHAFMAAAAAYMGDMTAANAHAKEVLARAPDFTISALLGTLHYSQESDREHCREGLLKAGLPA